MVRAIPSLVSSAAKIEAARKEIREALAVEGPLVERCESGRRAMEAARRASERTNAAYRALAALEAA